MMQGHEMFSGWGGMGLSPLPILIIPLLFIALVIWAIRAAFGSSRNGTPPSATARGEIDEEEFRTRLNALKP